VSVLVQLTQTLVTAGGGDGSWDWYTLSGMFTNLLLFLGFMVWVLKKPLQTYLNDRRSGLAKQLEAAQAKQEEAERRLAEYDHKLKNLENEIAAIVESHEAQGEADRQRLREETEKAIERLMREADFTINQESLKAQKAIRSAAVNATLEMAEQLVQDRITDADRRRLADEYVARIGKNGASA
jgi:F-type H+-transporting ATPase subunit b